MLKLFIVVLIFTTTALAQLPDAPSKAIDRDPTAPTAVRPTDRFVQERKDKLFNKKFIFASVALAASEIYDAEVSVRGLKHGRCVEAYGDPHSSRTQLYGRMIPIDAGIWGLALLMRKGHVPVAPYSTLMLGAGRHFYVGSEWFSSGCY